MVANTQGGCKEHAEYPKEYYINMVKKYILSCCRFPISECIKGYFVDQMEDDIYSSTKDAVNVLTPADNDLEQAIIDLGSV